MPIKKVKRKRIYLEVIDQILGLIKSGELKYNQKLPAETTLVEKFGISRPTIREALSALEVLGVLESRTGDGTYIIETNVDNILRKKVENLVTTEEVPHEIAEAREIIESELAWLVAKKAKKDDIERIQKALNKVEDEFKKSGKWTLESDLHFHSEIMNSLDNSILTKIGVDVLNLMNNKILKNLRSKIFTSGEKLDVYMNQHEQILKCLTENDSEGAKKIMREHINCLKKEVL
jgi:GntR family transcriptional regulator, transcriptional repressor for pyruvate dehydrogenase complex